MNVQFVSDANGKPTAVLLPIKEWERIQQYLPVKGRAANHQLNSKELLKEELREAVQEMKRAQAGEIELQDAEDFLAELRGLQS